MSYLESYIQDMSTDLNRKIFTNDAYVSQKMLNITVVEKGATMGPIEYDNEYANVNHEIMSFVMNEMWELHDLLANFNYACHLTMPALQELNDTNIDFRVRGKLMQDTHEHAMILKERIQKHINSIGTRADKVELVYDKRHSKTTVEALFFYDSGIRCQLIDDCKFLKYVYANLRKFIKNNNVHISAMDDSTPVINMML